MVARVRTAAAADIALAAHEDGGQLHTLAQDTRELVLAIGGPRAVIQWAKELDVFATLAYYALTTLSGTPTLGEEYGLVFQLAPHFAHPSLLRRTAAVGLHVVVPYLVRRCKARLQRVVATQEPGTGLGRLLALALEWADTVVASGQRLHLAAFYVFGVYRFLAHRILRLTYTTTSTSTAPAPPFPVLGGLLLLQLAVQGVAWLRARRRRQASTPHAPAASRQDEQGKAETDPLAPPDAATGRCPLCLGPQIAATSTPCGHLFCWACIARSCAQQAVCPLCRVAVAPQQLVRVFNLE